MDTIMCAFCKGRGKDPFNLLSELAICQVCGGTGNIEIKKPAIRCAYCNGTGVYPHGARITCTVCNGRGMVTVKGAPDGSACIERSEKCPECRGTGQEAESGLPCIECRGKGVAIRI